MGCISDTVIPFTIDEEILFCRKFTDTYRAFARSSPAAREAACLAEQFPACMCPPQPGDTMVGRMFSP